MCMSCQHFPLVTSIAEFQYDLKLFQSPLFQKASPYGSLILFLSPNYKLYKGKIRSHLHLCIFAQNTKSHKIFKWSLNKFCIGPLFLDIEEQLDCSIGNIYIYIYIVCRKVNFLCINIYILIF